MKSSFYYTIAVIAIVISIIELSLFFYSTRFTGYATATGTTNVTVTATASINFTTNNIDWGSGTVDLGAARAVLDTSSGATTNGSWSTQTSGFVIKNIGNVNVSIALNTGLNATTFIGGVGGSGPGYLYNVTNPTGACVNTTANFPMNIYVNANTTSTSICDKLYFTSANNSIRVDIRLIIPSDSKSGSLGDTITATYSQA